MTLLESDLSSFGTMLRTFRKRQRLTQKQLAEAIGVHESAIGRWERGDFLPDSKAMVLELARCLHLDDQESRSLLEASLTALSPHWSIPLPRNPFFTGREEILETLHARLGSDQAVALTPSSALHGLGGVGKTQIALEYAYRHALEYSAIFWIGAETDESIVASLLRIAQVLLLPERDEQDQQSMIAAVQRWLSTHSQWLVIWDNVEDLGLLNHFLSSARQGAFLITTRCQALGTLALGLGLLPMEREEAMLFLLRRAKVLAPEATREQMQQVAQRMPAQYAAAADLVTAMGGLPLALDQAGAYIEETGCMVSDYLQRYTQQRAGLLNRRGSPGADHPYSVTTTFRLSMERIEREQCAAADLLRMCAFLHADAVPEEVFTAEAAQVGPVFFSLATDPSQFNQTIAVLRRFSLVQRQAETRTLFIHRLVQAVLWEQMSEQERDVWQWRAIRLLNAAFPEIIPQVWTQCERLLPHVLTCTATIPEEACDPDLAELLRKAADYLRGRARFEQPEPLYRRALYIEERMMGREHRRVAVPLYGLGMLYWERGKYGQAELLCQQALSIWEHVLEPEHPELARPLIGVANNYLSQGKYAQAEPLYQRAMRITEQALGLEHPLLIAPLTNLAQIYNELGKYEQAEPLYQQAISILEHAPKGEGPLIAYPLHGLAQLYCRQGKYEQAEPLFRRTLAVREQELGSDHPYVAEPLTGLAIIAFQQGKDEQAEAGYQRALHLNEQGLGPNHPDVAIPLTHLADLYAKQGKDEQAESFYRRALYIREQGLGMEHHQVATTLNGLARLFLKQGRTEEAEAGYRRALNIQEQSLGQCHPETAQTLHDLTICLQKQTCAKEAAPAVQSTEENNPL